MTDEVRRLALVVVPGVGDAETSPATALHGALVGLEGASYTPAGEPAQPAAFVVGPTDPGTAWGPKTGTPDQVPKERLNRRRDNDQHDEIDLIELPWWDISRFPKGLPGFVATLFGLSLQLGTLGLEAIAGLGRGGGKRAKWTTRMLNVSSWAAAALVVPITAVTTVAAVNLWLVIDAPLGLSTWVWPAIVLPLGGLAAWFIAKAVAEGGWRYGHHLLDPRIWATVAYVALLVVWFWRLGERDSVRLASADTLLYTAAFGLRPAWLLALSLVAFGLAVLAIKGAWQGLRALFKRDGGAGFRRRWVTAVLATIFSPLSVALVGTLLIAGLTGVAFKSANDARWGTNAPSVTCLSETSSWSTGTECGVAPAQWPTTAVRIAQLDQQAHELNKQADNESDPGNAVDLRSKAAGLTKRADAFEADAGMTPVDWARALFVIVAIPVTNAAVAVVALLVAVALVFVLAMVVVRNSPGRMLAGLLRTFGSRLMSVVLLAVGIAGVVMTWSVWMGWLGPNSVLSGDPWGSSRGRALAGAGAAIAGLLLIARFLPIDLRDWGGSVGKLQWRGGPVAGNLEALRARLDPVYDIATYLRIYRNESGIRPKIIARYRALLSEINRRDYDALLIVAHSQGTVLSAATLFGDRHRREPEANNPAGLGVRPYRDVAGPPSFPDDTVLLTCGCPLRQSYDARLPGDYNWLWSEDKSLEPWTWINAYRPRDYIGQAVFQEPLKAATQEQGRVFPADDENAEPAARIDVCLRGSGGHGGYWTDAEFTKWVDYAIRRCLDPADAEFPDGYAEERSAERTAHQMA